jgi:hypothetical protein
LTPSTASARLPYRDTELMVERTARLKVLAPGVESSEKGLGPALEEASPRFEHGLVELPAQLARVRRDPSCRLGVARCRRELAGCDLGCDAVSIPDGTALEQQVGEANAVGLPEPEEEIPRPCKEAHAGARVGRGGKLQRRTDVLVVVVELVHEPLPAGREPFLERDTAECREVREVAFPSSRELPGFDKELLDVLTYRLEQSVARPSARRP